MVSGSVAANLYVEPRFTNDVDIVIQAVPAHKKILLLLFAPDYYVTDTAIDDAFRDIGMFNIIHSKTLFKCDLILLKNDEFSQSAFRRRTQEKLEGIHVHFISLEDLLLQKILWMRETGSELQKSDVKKLIEGHRATLDTDYCRSWADKLDCVSSLEELL
jgi:hypothetical protein